MKPELFTTLPADERIVATTVHRERLYIATGRALYRLVEERAGDSALGFERILVVSEGRGVGVEPESVPDASRGELEAAAKGLWPR